MCCRLREAGKSLYKNTPHGGGMEICDGRLRSQVETPNCIGAMDGKHVLTKKPPNSETIYRNSKKCFSIILFAVVDANHRFMYTDVGAPGSEGDAAVWQTIPLQKDVEDRRAGLPELAKVSSSPDVFLPPVFVADDAFRMGRNLMKPFGGTNLTEDKKIFNYR